MRIAIATVQVPFVRGGAEMMAESLCEELMAAGHEAEVVSIPYRWYPADRIAEHMLACRLVDLTESRAGPIDRMIALKFPAYMMRHPHKTIWLMHQHRGAYDLWGEPHGDLTSAADGAHVCTAIRAADGATLPEARAIYTLSANVSHRLLKYCGLHSVPLHHPPPGAEQFRAGEYGNYLLFSSRINPLKRQAMAIEALSRTRHPVHLAFLGIPDMADYGAQVRRAAVEAGVENRVTWLGRVSEEKKLALYAGCRAVIFPPVDEDYGYVTQEAMLSRKAVITCSDSGGPLEFTEHGQTGLVCEPKASALTEAFDRLWEDTALAARLGNGGLERYIGMRINWGNVLQCLLG